MPARFNFNNIRSVEFGACLDTDNGESFRLVPVARDVQDALKEMLLATHGALFRDNEAIAEFTPAEKYSAHERLKLDLASEMVQKHREVFTAENLPFDSGALDNPNDLIGYFAVFRDAGGHKLMAFRRAAQFKGVLQKKLLRFSDDALRLIQDNVFRLDQDFDFLILHGQVFIWRPSAFEFSADLEQYIAQSSVENVARISARIKCVDCTGINAFVAKHKRAMRLIAAIKSRDDLEHTTFRELQACCVSGGVSIERKRGRMWPAAGHEMDFLMILDRRRYSMTLIKNVPEIYEAPSRRRAQ